MSSNLSVRLSQGHWVLFIIEYVAFTLLIVAECIQIVPLIWVRSLNDIAHRVNCAEIVLLCRPPEEIEILIVIPLVVEV